MAASRNSPTNRSKNPSPFVYWGQNSQYLFLKVKLQIPEESPPDVSITENEISLTAFGTGANGQRDYTVDIEFMHPVVPEGSRLKIVGGEIVMNIKKATKDQQWSRLTKSNKKPSWVKVDFDRLDVSGDDEEAENKRLQEDYIKKVMGDVMETEKKAIADIKKYYLFSYNFFQFVSFSFVFFKMLYGLSSTTDYLTQAYADVSLVLKISQCMAILEFIHPLTGLVKSGVLAPLMQLFGRNFILFVLIPRAEAVQSSPFVAYLFLTWSSVELTRYPFYMLTTMDLELKLVTWLRYTVWIVLYPMGALWECLVVWTSASHFEQTDEFSVFLPNWLNISFNFPIFLKLYCAVIVTGVAYLMTHMQAQRAKKFKSSSSLSATKKTQ